MMKRTKLTRHEQRIWHSMLARSFTPRQWYDIEPDDDEDTEDFPMWVYRLVAENRWSVGYWTPDKVWVEDSVHDSRARAAARVHYLHGGTTAA